MTESRKLLLGSVWALENQGFDEFKAKIQELCPAALYEIEHLHASHAVSVSGPFEHDEEVKIARMLAEFISDHQSPDIFQIPRIREIRSILTIPPVPSSLATAIPPQQETPTLVENIEPDQRTADGNFFEEWIPSRADLWSFTRGSLCLLPAISEISQVAITEVAVEGQQGLRISAPQKESLRQAIEMLESLGECFNCIASPHQGLIIHAPHHDNSTFRVMKYANISANALRRFLIDPSSLCDLFKWTTLVVCQLDPETNTVHPVKNIREPPQVKKKPGVCTTEDWKGVKFPEIGTRDSYSLSKIDKHLAPKRESSVKNIAAQHPYLSPSKAKQVDKWIARDTTTKDIQQDEPNKRELSLQSRAGTPTVVSSHDEESLRSRREKAEGLKTRLTFTPGGELTNARRKPLLSQPPKQVDQSIGKKLEQRPPSVSTTGPKEDSVLILGGPKRSYGYFLTRGQQARAMAADLSSSSANLAKSIVSDDPKLAFKQPDIMAESDDLLIDNNEPKVKSTSLRTEEIKEKIGSTDSTPTNTKVNFPSSSTSAQGNPQPPMPASENQHTQPQKKQYFFKDLLALRPRVPHEQKINAKEYNVQKRQNMINRDEMCDTYWRRSPASHGRSNSYGTSSGTSNEIPYARTVSSVPIDRPVSKDTRLKPLTERSSYSSSTPAPGLGGPRSSNSPAGRSNIPTLGTAESTRGQRWERLQGNLPTSSLKETEKALLNFLQRVIDKEHRSKATAAMGILQDLPSPFDGNTPFTPTRGTNTLIGTPTSVPTSASVSAPAIEETSLLIAFEEAPAPLKRQENVSFLHPDLIDLSPASLRTKLRYDAVRRSNQSPDDQDDKPEICEKIADTEETQTRDYHTTMFHQQPSKFADYGMDGVSETTESARNGRNGDSNELTSGGITPNVSVNSHETAVQRCTPQIFKTAVKLPKERQALIDLFNSLGLSLDRVRDFPGPLTLEIQLGLMLILNTTASTQETEMTYKEVQNLFFSQHGLEAPRTSFFDRLTSSPADIDHLIGLKINDKPLFDQYATLRSIKYEFRCRASSNTIFIISVDQHRTVTLRYPRVHLGAVSMSFPAQVWDASAVLQGSTRFNRKADLELEKAVRELVESIWIDPESVTLQMLIRPPSTEVMTILGVYMERRTSHRWISEQSERIYLKVAETQVLNMTPSILDPEILVVNCAPHEEMLRHGKHWWQASITSAEIERILKQNLHVKPGTRNDSWNTVDLFGSDLTLINPSAKLSALGASVDHSGIGAMFRLAKIIVEKIDAIGFFNKGPAAYISRSPTDRGASTGAVSGEARSGTVSKSQDWNMAVGGWNPSAPSKPLKHRW